MELTQDNLFKLIDEVCTFDEINLSDIPCVDLYMDQVTTFFDEKLKNLKRDEEDKILTKTMINNYAKAKLLLPVKGKKYTKEQIVLLSLIYNLKQILSINDIGSVLSPIIKSLNTGNKSIPLEEIYSSFLDINKIQMEELNSSFKDKALLVRGKASNIDADNKDLTMQILTVLMLISSANAQKRMAEKIIDNFLKSDKDK
jgi:hypothetical protein